MLIQNLEDLNNPEMFKYNSAVQQRRIKKQEIYTKCVIWIKYIKCSTEQARIIGPIIL